MLKEKFSEDYATLGFTVWIDNAGTRKPQCLLSKGYFITTMRLENVHPNDVYVSIDLTSRDTLFWKIIKNRVWDSISTTG